MLKKDFWYDLPKELIAQEPADPRDSARLMVLSQKDDSIQHKIFHDLPEFLEPGDLLVVNNSKVLPARIVGVKQPTGAVCELLLLRQVKGDQWECLAKPGKRMQPGTKVSFGDGSLTAVVDETMEDGNKYVTFYYDTETLYEKLDEFGKMPLPPYITKQLEDQSQYQTVYAKELGSAAAPTAGLHFTPELMDTIRAKGVNIAEVTLHVGLGTFRPVQEDEIADHKMHSEWYCIDEKTAQMIRDTKAAGHRVIAGHLRDANRCRKSTALQRQMHTRSWDTSVQGRGLCPACGSGHLPPCTGGRDRGSQNAQRMVLHRRKNGADDPRYQGCRSPCDRSGHYQLPHAGSCCRKVRRDPRLQRQHFYLPVSRREVQLHRRPDHQLPPAGKHPYHAGVGPVWLRKDHGSL